MSSNSNQLPNLESLFGPVSSCQCQECGSLYSPAAYLVDLLYSIMESKITAVVPNNPTLTGMDVLNGGKNTRRPDIENLELTCENTNTPVPYVDLVNEILENAVGPVQPFPQTLGTAEELAANPEHVNTEAYNKNSNQKNPANSVYPWNLPFDLPTEKARLYLGQLGVTRSQLQALFRQKTEKLDEQAVTVLTDSGIAAEALGLTNFEQLIVIAQMLNPPNPWEFWGYPDSHIQTPNQPQDSWIADDQYGLIKVSVFLQKSGLPYNEVLDLLACSFINPGNVILPKDPSGTCDIKTMTLTGLTAAALDRLHRFVRLRAKLGWTAAQLDQAIQVFGGNNPELTPDLLVRLWHVQRLNAGLGVPVPSLVAWWATTIDTRGDGRGGKSLYEQIFENKSVVRPPDPFQVDPNTHDLEKGLLVKDNLPAVSGALGIGTSDLLLLVDTHEVSGDLNLATLTQLYAVVTFSKALKLAIKEYLSLKTLTGINPFDANHTEDTLRFVREVAKIRDAGFSVAELDYLLRDVRSVSSGIEPPAADIAAVLTELGDSLEKIAADNQLAPDPSGVLVQKKLATVLPPGGSPNTTSLAMVLLGDVPSNSASEKQTVKQYFSDDASKTRFIKDNFTAFLDPAAAADKLVGGNALDHKEARYEYVLAPLVSYIRRTQSESVVKDKLASALNRWKPASGQKLDASAVDKLLTGGVSGTGGITWNADVTKPGISDFLPIDDSDLGQWRSGLRLFAADPQRLLDNPDTFVQDALAKGNKKAMFDRLLDQLGTVSVLHKTALMVSRFGITAEQLTWVLKNGPGKDWVGWLDPNQLPPRGTMPYAAWERLMDLISARDALPAGTLLEVLKMSEDNAADEDSLLKLLSSRTGWRLEDIQSVAGSSMLGLVFRSNQPYKRDYEDERALNLLKAALELVRRLGISADKVLEWCSVDVSTSSASDIKAAVKAKYDYAAWLAVAKPIEDTLREKRRAALVSFLIGNGQQFSSTSDLFDHFLIDVEMSPCQMTSRIKQAISSVQLFVQRCLMSLESYSANETSVNVTIDPDGVRWWRWMNSYRVWEANRKVFLYPENWLDWTLLDQKTPLFEELQSELLQGDLTAEGAEEAFRNYLEKLDQVARLEVVGLHHQRAENEDPDILHVFGRTWATGHVYFYRQRITLDDVAAYWTPWEKVNVDIQGDHLIPVVWNRRLHIFWPVFTQKSSPQTLDPSQKIPPPDNYWEIQFAWSEYKNGKWTAKQLSSGPPLTTSKDWRTADGAALMPENFHFKAVVNGDDLTVQCTFLQGAVAEFTHPQWIQGTFVSMCNGTLLAQTGDQAGDFPVISTPPLLLDGEKFVDMMVAQGNAIDLSISAGDNAGDQKPETILRATPTPYRLLYPEDEIDRFYSQDTFFYQDDKRTFLVEPQAEPPSLREIAKASPGWVLDQPLFVQSNYRGAA